ncbi:hypothetical protein N6H14_20390 [Paenibacillus sp. CC-CFT747]|nr:hypothetical protein N6H14_20390 [Paenibacillus sp. CC-CFT747]
MILSGGKEIRGPQSSGLILGGEEWIKACNANNFPNFSIGRSMKLDKETIAGIVKAVELFVRKDYDQEMNRWEAMVSAFIEKLSKLPSIQVRRGFPVSPGIQPAIIPRVFIKHCDISAAEFQSRLLNSDPIIHVDVQGDELVLNPQCLEDHDVSIVVESIIKQTAVY